MIATDPALQRRCYRFGLFKNFFLHVMAKSSALDCICREVSFFDRTFCFSVISVAPGLSPGAYARLILSRGAGPLSVAPDQCPEPNLVCIVDDVTLYSEQKRAEGLSLVTSSLRRPAADVLERLIESDVKNALENHESGEIYRTWLERVERPLLETVLSHTDGNQIRAASLLGINRNTLRKKIADLGIVLPGRQ